MTILFRPQGAFGWFSYTTSWDTIVLIGRQKNEPPVFLSDQYRKPDETVERIRAVFSREVVAYPQRETETEERKDLEEYVRMTKARCYSAYMKSVAPDS